VPDFNLKEPRVAVLSSQAPEALKAADRLAALYPMVAPGQANVIVALGGDGVMLQTLHSYMGMEIPIYGMHRGSVGFLMNEYQEYGLLERIQAAKLNIVHPLKMTARDMNGRALEALAINEVSMFRQTYQAARLSLSVDGNIRLSELICDGVLIATPAGSTAYNLSVGGPILPLKAPLLALTPISPFRPRRWRGALLPNTAQVTVAVLEADRRPVSAVADHQEFRNVAAISVREERNVALHLLFDPGHALEERILAEQFRY
jgi:NAD+ kinase